MRWRALFEVQRAISLRLQQREWRSPADTPPLEVLSLVAEGELPPEIDEISPPPALSDPDGKPLPVAAPEIPEGQVDLASESGL